MSTKITINGQQYDSPDAMPPDVRRTYEEAMRTAGSALESAKNDGKTQVFTGHAGPFGASVVVNRTIVVNDRKYGSVDELPPEMRQLYENAMKGGATSQTTHPKTHLHLSLNLDGPEVRTLHEPGKSPAPAPLPIDSSSTESKLRSLPVSLAIAIGIGLVLWALLGR